MQWYSSMKIPALLLLGPPGESEIEHWISLAKRAAALDLVQRMNAAGNIETVYVYTPDLEFAEPLKNAGAVLRKSSAGDFNFGRQLHICVDDISSECFAYFGAASAPLLSAKWIRAIVEQLVLAENPWACVNNFHSTDWAFFNFSSLLSAADQHLPADNSLGWVARNICGFNLVSVPVSAASRADLDTPTDLLMMEGHADLGSQLAAIINESNFFSGKQASEIKSLISTPAKTLALIGRVSSVSSRRLEKATQIWTRVFSEERGMAASGRLSRGEVTSLAGKVMLSWGASRFVEELEQLADGVLWDTRVVMAQLFGWPSASDRFAFDLGRTDMLSNDEMGQWCNAIRKSAVPILSGGHGVVSGGLLALLESVYPQLIPEFDIIQIP